MRFIRILAASALIGGSISACGDAGKDNMANARVLSVETRSVDDLNLTVKELETPAELKAKIAAQAAAADKNLRQESTMKLSDDTLAVVDVAVDQIINIGKKVWAVVAAGAPVMNVKFDFATAMPKGIKSASELHGFSDLQFKSFEYTGTNFYGIEVFKVQYTVVYQYGGSYAGKGAFIASASIVPQDVSVLWGYSLNMNVDNVSVANLGTSDSPVAGMNLLANIKVSTVIKATEVNELFAIRGDNGLLSRVH